MPNQTDHSTEPLLLADLRNGSVKAFEEIFRSYWHTLYHLAKRKLRSHDEAEEVIQGIFSTLWERRETLFIANLSYYLNTALRNRILNILRDKITREKYWEYYRSFVPGQHAFTDDIIHFDDLRDAVELAVNDLPEKSREVFKLSRLEGRSNAEIAKMLKVSEKAIEYHLTKSLKALKIQLRDFKI